MTTTTYLVSGMTCGHCVSAVTEEIGKLDGVTGVDGRPGRRRDVPGDRDQHGDRCPTTRSRAAVDEAGYDLVGAGR